MKHRLTLITAAVLLLSMMLSMTACGKTSAPNDTTVQTGEAPNGGDVTADGKETGKTDPVATSYPALELREPEKITSDKVTLEISHKGSGSVQNAEGESFAYDRSDEDFLREGDMEIYANEYYGTYFAGDLGVKVLEYSLITVRDSDNIKLMTDSGEAGIHAYYDGENGSSWIDVSCTGDGKIEIVYENAGDKVTVSGDNVNFEVGGKLYYYLRTNRRLLWFTLKGETNGSITLEKEADGWYLSGAESDVTLCIRGDEKYYKAHRSEKDVDCIVQIAVPAPTDGERLRVEEYIPEVKEQL